MSDTPAIDNEKLADMLARQEIRDVLARYARGVDRADREMLESCYHEDAIEEHGPNYSGPAMDYIAGAIDRLKLMGDMAHYLCQSHIELNGDTAGVETYVITFARFNDESGEVDTLTGGRICDRFERRDGQWRIAHRRLAFDWNRDMAANQGWCLGMFDTTAPGFHGGRKDREDLSYQLF
jgi:ketosteroid isomerase-like protein